MKHFALLVSTALLIGCADNAVETTSAPETNAANPKPDTPELDSTPVTTAFGAGQSATLEIPEMHCPFGCFPKAKDALEEIDGVASVDLVDQKEEDVIDDRRVVVTFDGSVDGRTAISALDAVDLAGASFESAKTSDN